MFGNHPKLKKNVYICFKKNILYTKLIYFDHPNKNVDMRIIK